MPIAKNLEQTGIDAESDQHPLVKEVVPQRDGVSREEIPRPTALNSDRRTRTNSDGRCTEKAAETKTAGKEAGKRRLREEKERWRKHIDAMAGNQVTEEKAPDQKTRHLEQEGKE